MSLGLVLLCSVSPSQEPPATQLLQYEQAWADSDRALAEAPDLQRYEARLALLASPLFEKLPGLRQHDRLLSTGTLGVKLKQFASAHPLLVRSSGMREQNFDDWHQRLLAAAGIRDSKDSRLALTHIVQGWPAEAPAYSQNWIFQLVAGRTDSEEERTARFELLLALYHAHYRNEYGAVPGELFAMVARELVERGRVTEALEVISQINSPRAIVDMRIDRSFEAVVRQAPERFDVEAAARRQIRDYQEAVRRHPRTLDAVTQLCYAYLDAGRYRDVLLTTNLVLNRVSDPDVYRKTYEEDETAVNWLLDLHSQAALAEERPEEAVASLELASEGLEHQTLNVSNVINLGILYANLDQPDKALRVISQIGDESRMSPGGRMVWHQVRAHAAYLKGDESMTRESLDYLRAHKDDAVGIYQEALLRTNRLDEAAGFLISRLKDPDRYRKALAAVQTYREPPAPPGMQRYRAQWREVLKRDDVQRAIAAVGHIESFPIPPED